MTGSTVTLYVARTADGGVTWTQQALGTETTLLSQPQVAISADGQRAVILAERLESGNPRLRSFTSDNGGASWSASTDVSIASTGFDPMNPQLTLSSDGNQVGAFWTRYASGSIVQAEFASSTNGGVTWSAPIRLNATFSSSSASAPSLAASDDGSVLVAGWAELGGDEPAFVARSTNFGATWGPYTQVTTGSINVSGTAMAASSSGHVMATLIDSYSYTSSASQLTYAVSDDTGATWDDSGVIAAQEETSSELLMNDSGSVITSIWSVYSGSTYTISSRTSRNRGATSDDSVVVSSSASSLADVSAAMSADGSQIMAVWTRNNSSVEVSTSTDRGATWSAPTVLSDLAVAPTVILNADASFALVGWSHSGRVIQAVTAPPPPAPPAPATPADPPRDVSAAPADRGATVSWSAPASSGSFPVSHYLVSSLSGGKTCLTVGLTCEVTGLTNGSAYSFTVKALTGAGWSAASEPSNAVVPRPSAGPSIVITGSREGQRIEVMGSTIGFGMGAILNPWVRLAGQTAYSQGSAEVLVTTEGTFEWGRKTGRKASVYMQTPDGSMRSNTVMIRARS